MHISYKRAVEWIARNEDLSFLDQVIENDDAPPVTVAFCADMFGKDDKKVAQDVQDVCRRIYGPAVDGRG